MANESAKKIKNFIVENKLTSEYLLLICYGIARFSNTAIIIFTYWYVWEQTKSAMVVSLIGAVSGIAALSGLFTGLIVDRFDKYKLIIFCDFFKFLLMFILFISLFLMEFSTLLVCSILLIVGILNQVYSPAMRTHMITVLGENKISSINGKLFTIEQLSIVGGASITGIFIIPMGIFSYILISAMFLSSFLLLLVLKRISQHHEDDTDTKMEYDNKYNFKSLLSDFKSTYSFIYNNKLLLHTTPLILILFFCFSPFLVLLSIWSDVVLNKGALGYSLMETFFPIGMMIGGLLSTLLIKILDSRKILSLSLFLSASMTLSFSLSKNLII